MANITKPLCNKNKGERYAVARHYSVCHAAYARKGSCCITKRQTGVSSTGSYSESAIGQKAWFVKVNRQLPPSQIPVWQKLQKQVPANSKHYAELSFMLAYYGVDYDANLRRVTRPYRFWRQNIQRGKDYRAYAKEYPSYPDDDWVAWGGTWFPLNLLYLKRHDTESLSAWLEQELDGCAAEGSSDELGKLWKRHQNDMLRAAYGSDIRQNGLTQSLVFDYVFDNVVTGNRQSERRLLAEISRLEHSSDPHVASSARQIYGKVKAEAARWIREQTGWKHHRS